MRHVHLSVALACVLPALTPASGHGASLVGARSASAVDWVAAGIGGVPGDTAHITVTGVTGPVTKAYLYWGGLNAVLSTSFYDNPTVTIDGNPVTGTSLGTRRRTAGARAAAASTSRRSRHT